MSKGVENAAVQHRELVEKLRSVDSILGLLPRYLACATRGDEGALARVRVRYDRKSLTGKDQHRDIPRDIGIGIALKRRVLVLANLGTFSNVN